jgi:hypothetical protein
MSIKDLEEEAEYLISQFESNRKMRRDLLARLYDAMTKEPDKIDILIDLSRRLKPDDDYQT